MWRSKDSLGEMSTMPWSLWIFLKENLVSRRGVQISFLYGQLSRIYWITVSSESKASRGKSRKQKKRCKTWSQPSDWHQPARWQTRNCQLQKLTYAATKHLIQYDWLILSSSALFWCPQVSSECYGYNPLRQVFDQWNLIACLAAPMYTALQWERKVTRRRVVLEEKRVIIKGPLWKKRKWNKVSNSDNGFKNSWGSHCSSLSVFWPLIFGSLCGLETFLLVKNVQGACHCVSLTNKSFSFSL